jgi:hypothetical protein
MADGGIFHHARTMTPARAVPPHVRRANHFSVKELPEGEGDGELDPIERNLLDVVSILANGPGSVDFSPRRVLVRVDLSPHYIGFESLSN